MGLNKLVRKIRSSLCNNWGEGVVLNNYFSTCEQQMYIRRLENKIRVLEGIIEKGRKKERELKTGFLKNIYHEIRTPMNAILGFTALLDQHEFEAEKQERYNEHIRRSSDEFLKVIDDIVEAALIDAGQIEIKKEEFDLDPFFKELHNHFTIKKHAHGKDSVAFLKKVPMDNERKTMVFTDKTRLYQVMVNLLSNAFKFTERGIIEYGWYFNSDDECEFFVADTGIGGVHDREVIAFEDFSQLEDAKYAVSTGLGLGLSISKKLIELLGGSIRVMSNKEKGSTFRFKIPVSCKSTNQASYKKVFTGDYYYPRLKKPFEYRQYGKV